MKSNELFNGLNGCQNVDRSEIIDIIELAKQENNTDVIYRLSKILNSNPNADDFNFEIIQFPETGLNGSRHTGDYREALDECGRLKKGFRFKNGKVVKVAPKVKPIKKSEAIKKDVTAVEKITFDEKEVERLSLINLKTDIATYKLNKWLSDNNFKKTSNGLVPDEVRKNPEFIELNKILKAEILTSQKTAKYLKSNSKISMMQRQANLKEYKKRLAVEIEKLNNKPAVKIKERKEKKETPAVEKSINNDFVDFEKKYKVDFSGILDLLNSGKQSLSTIYGIYKFDLIEKNYNTYVTDFLSYKYYKSIKITPKYDIYNYDYNSEDKKLLVSVDLLTHFPAKKISKKSFDENLKNIVGKDLLRPVMTGVFVDKNAYVSTDAHVLVSLYNESSKNEIGKIININIEKDYKDYLKMFLSTKPELSKSEYFAKHKYIDGIYPKYKNVIPDYSSFSDFIDIDYFIKICENFLKYTEKINDFYYKITLGNKENNVSVHPKNALRVFKSLAENGNKKIKIAYSLPNRALMIKTESKDYGLIMPIYTKDTDKVISSDLITLENAFNNKGLSGSLSSLKAETPAKKIVTKFGLKNQDNQLKLLGAKKQKPALKSPVQENDNVNKHSLAYRLQNKGNVKHEYYIIPDKEISNFLGQIEKKNKESVAITIAGGQGSMKTRLCFQLMNAFAQNYKVGHASIEEHPESKLYEDKIHQYLNNKALNNIVAPEIENINDVHKLCRENDVIVIDSFSKLQEMQKGCELDKDFRKAYDGKLFIIIYQLTGDGKMRGGSKSQFDGDIISFVKKEDNYKDNYCYHDKNRYNNANLEDLKFNIFSGKINQTETQKREVQPKETIQFSFNAK